MPEQPQFVHDFQLRLIAAVDRATRFATAARSALHVVLDLHSFEREGDRVVCADHFGPHGARVDWPCLGVRGVATALGVPLNPPPGGRARRSALPAATPTVLDTVAATVHGPLPMADHALGPASRAEAAITAAIDRGYGGRVTDEEMAGPVPSLPTAAAAVTDPPAGQAGDPA